MNALVYGAVCFAVPLLALLFSLLADRAGMEEPAPVPPRFNSDRPCGDACPYPVADCWVCEAAPVNR